MPTDLTQVVSALGVAGEAMGVGDALPARKKPAPKAPVIDDVCLDRHNSEISHDAAYAGAVIQDQLDNNEFNGNPEWEYNEK